ncbi:uncharacterized protein LOC135923215 isoform X2 [Gordionus sp. m RMFG-2023]|uniref:uncharacterized protein LOC135923215 isoform X2 n=1 Tax=Gordionus sp. m RMFG-2023 TaxID=3053472 RepID=UPI0031FE2973
MDSNFNHIKLAQLYPNYLCRLDFSYIKLAQAYPDPPKNELFWLTSPRTYFSENPNGQKMRHLGNIQPSIPYSYISSIENQDHPRDDTLSHSKKAAKLRGLAMNHLTQDQTRDTTFILNIGHTRIPTSTDKYLDSNKKVLEINKFRPKSFDPILKEFSNDTQDTKINYLNKISDKILTQIQNHSIWNPLKKLTSHLHGLPHFKIDHDLNSLEFIDNNYNDSTNNVSERQHQIQLKTTGFLNDSFLNEDMGYNTAADIVSPNHVIKRTEEGKFDKRGLPVRYIAQNQQIRNICNSIPTNITSPENVFDDIDMSFVFVHENIKIIWCMIPKCGTTFWRKILMGINKGIYNMSMVTQLPWLFTKNSKTLNYHKQKNTLDIIHKYPKFIFTRHPFERLHSAYIDKILGSNNYVVNAVHEEIKNIMRLKHLTASNQSKEGINSSIDNSETTNTNYGGKFKVLTNGSLEEAWIRPPWSSNISDEGKGGKEEEDSEEEEEGNEEDDHPLTFSQFLSYIVEHEKYFPGRSMNAHWQPSYNICQPCNIPYDFVGKLENMNIDGQVLFDMLEFSKLMPFPADLRPNHSFRKIGDTKSIFRALDPELYKKIRHVYDQDFKMFNYSDMGYDPSKPYTVSSPDSISSAGYEVNDSFHNEEDNKLYDNKLYDEEKDDLNYDVWTDNKRPFEDYVNDYHDTEDAENDLEDENNDTENEKNDIEEDELDELDEEKLEKYVRDNEEM